jgi:hypothetical protein
LCTTSPEILLSQSISDLPGDLSKVALSNKGLRKNQLAIYLAKHHG